MTGILFDASQQFNAQNSEMEGDTDGRCFAFKNCTHDSKLYIPSTYSKH